MRRLAPWILAPIAAVSLAACNNAAGDAAAPAEVTMNAAIAADDQFDTLEAVVENAGLEAVLNGVGPYTVIAPVNDAFNQSGAPDFTADDMAAQGAELVRAHLLPGTVTREDLLAAIDRGGADGATLLTMADEVLTFTRDGDAIVVTAENGATARLTGREVVASNGVIQPADGLLIGAAPAG